MNTFDPNSSELRELYSFNPENLKQRFFELANNAFVDHNTYMKQYNLLCFRELFPQFPLPDLLFTYSTNMSYDIDLSNPISDMLKLYLDDANLEKTGSYSISTILRHCFNFENPFDITEISPKTQLFKPEPTFYETRIKRPKEIEEQLNYFTSPAETSISFINDFFCISTFPALFAHFSSEEYIRAGFNFIKRHIKDSLAPNLVAVYLLHCSQFKNRFIESFIDNIIYNFDQIKNDDHFNENLEKAFSTDNLLDAIYNSFGECTSYFTEFHFKIVALLRDEDEDAALYAVCDYFLREIVSLFKYSPILSETGLLSKTHCPKNPLTFARISRINYLDSIADQICINRSFSMKILNLFRDMSYCYLEMPKISTMKYADGYGFCLSLADMRVVQCIYLAEKNTKKTIDEFPRYTNVKDFISEIFTIKAKFKQYIKSNVDEPKRTETSPEMTAKKIEEQKEFHEFLTERSDGMKHLEICSSCALYNLKLKESQYINRLWENFNKVSYSIGLDGRIGNSFSISSSPMYYEAELLTSLIYSLINGLLHLDTKSALNTNMQELYPLIKEYILKRRVEKPLRDFVFETATYFLDNICNFTKNGKSFDQELVEPSKYICDAIERTTFELLVTTSNSIPCRFIKSELPKTPAGEVIDSGINFDEFRSINLAQFLSFNRDKPPPLPKEEDVIDNDDIISCTQVEACAETLLEGSIILKTIIALCNRSMEKEFHLVTEKFRTGIKLNLFLAIQNMIEKSLERCDFGHLGPDYLKYYYQYVIKDDFKFFMANLINCIDIFTQYLSQCSNLYPSMTKEILRKLKFLQTAFNISPKISRLVY